jgi:O-methyltransferase domain
MKKFKPDTREELLILGNLHIAARAIHILAEYPIADTLLAGPKSSKEIAKCFRFDAAALQKLLRILCTVNVLEEERDLFSLTPVGKYLCHSHPDSLKDLLFWDETRWGPLGKLGDTLKTGTESFSLLYGEGYFDHLSKQPDLQKAFDRHMRSVSFQENQILAGLLPLRGCTHLIDVGGGEGGLLAAILEKNSSIQASLFDLPETIDAVSATLKKKYPGRITCLKGSFFEPIRAACDAAILKRVLHDWNDAQCIDILKQVKGVLPPNGELYLIETVLKGKEDTLLVRLFDLFLLTVFGGKERTLADYEQLLTKAGLHLAQIIETSSSMSILIAKNF